MRFASKNEYYSVPFSYVAERIGILHILHRTVPLIPYQIHNIKDAMKIELSTTKIFRLSATDPRALDGNLMSVALYGPSWHSKPRVICSPDTRVLGSHNTVVLSESKFCGWMSIFSTVRFKARSRPTMVNTVIQSEEGNVLRTRLRIKVKNNGLSVVDAWNIIPAWITYTSSISCSGKLEPGTLSWSGTLTPVCGKTTLEIFEFEIGDLSTRAVCVFGTTTFVLRCHIFE